MKLYEVNGIKRLYPEGQAPDGAVLVTKARPEPKASKVVVEIDGEPVEETKKETKSKSRRSPRNKSRKADSNK